MHPVLSNDYTTMNVQELAQFTKKQELLYKQLREDDIEASIDAEEVYANARALFFKKLKVTKKEKSSENGWEIEQKLKNKPKLAKRELGISKLNMLLRNKDEVKFNKIGGMTQANFIQVVAPSGVGKSSLLLKIATDLSHYEKVSWIDYERGEDDFFDELDSYKNRMDTKNLEYLDGTQASNELEFICEEVTILAHTGIKNFFIDSYMAIMVNGENDSATWAKTIAIRLANLSKSLKVNIYIVNQINSKDSEYGRREPMWGVASRYFTDIMIFLQKIPEVDENGRPLKDDVGQPIMKKDQRLLTIDKNRRDKSWGEGSIILTEADIFGEHGNEPFEIIYDEHDNENTGNGNFELPMI